MADLGGDSGWIAAGSSQRRCGIDLGLAWDQALDQFKSGSSRGRFGQIRRRIEVKCRGRSGLLRGRVAVDLGSIRDRSGNDWGTTEGRSEVDLGSNARQSCGRFAVDPAYIPGR